MRREGDFKDDFREVRRELQSQKSEVEFRKMAIGPDGETPMSIHTEQREQSHWRSEASHRGMKLPSWYHSKEVMKAVEEHDRKVAQLSPAVETDAVQSRTSRSETMVPENPIRPAAQQNPALPEVLSDGKARMRAQTLRFQVFICHGMENVLEAKEIAKLIRGSRKSFTTWLDKEDLLPAQLWREVIPEVVLDSQAFILLLSKPIFARNGYVHQEMRLAIDAAHSMPFSSEFILPIKLDDVKTPRDLDHIHAINYSDPDFSVKIIQALVMIRKKLGARSIEAGG